MNDLHPKTLEYFRTIERCTFDSTKTLHIKICSVINDYLIYLDHSNKRADFKILQNITNQIQTINALKKKNVDYTEKILKLYYADQLVEYKNYIKDISNPNYSWRSRKGRQKNRAIIDQRIANYSSGERFNYNLIMGLAVIIILVLFFIAKFYKNF